MTTYTILRTEMRAAVAELVPRRDRMRIDVHAADSDNGEQFQHPDEAGWAGHLMSWTHAQRLARPGDSLLVCTYSSDELRNLIDLRIDTAGSVTATIVG